MDSPEESTYEIILSMVRISMTPAGSHFVTQYPSGIAEPSISFGNLQAHLTCPVLMNEYIHLSLRGTGAPVGAPVFAGTLPCKSLPRKRGAVKSRQNESRIRNSLHPQESLGDFEDAVESVIHRSENGHPRKSMDFLRVSMPFE